MDGATRRFRTGSQAPVGVGKAVSGLLVAAAFIGLGAGDGAVGVVVFGGVVAALMLWFLVYNLSAFRPVLLDAEPPGVSVPTFSLRRGFTRRTWSAGDDVRVDLVRCGVRFPYFAARFTDAHGAVRTLSVTCAARRWGVDLADREQTPAGRAVAEIAAVLHPDHP